MAALAAEWEAEEADSKDSNPWVGDDLIDINADEDDWSMYISVYLCLNTNIACLKVPLKARPRLRVPFRLLLAVSAAQHLLPPHRCSRKFSLQR